MPQSAPFPLEEVSKDPRVYRIKDPSLGEKKVFFTVIKECPVKEDRTLFATTRSLFIGLEQLNIFRQSELQFENLLLLKSEATAVVEGNRISLLVFSERTQDCVRDLLVWTIASEDKEERWKEIFEDKNRLMDLLRKE